MHFRAQVQLGAIHISSTLRHARAPSCYVYVASTDSVGVSTTDNNCYRKASEGQETLPSTVYCVDGYDCAEGVQVSKGRKLPVASQPLTVPAH